MFNTQSSQSNFGIFNKPSTSQCTFGFNQPQRASQSNFGIFGAVKPSRSQSTFFEQPQLPIWSIWSS